VNKARGFRDCAKGGAGLAVSGADGGGVIRGGGSGVIDSSAAIAAG
jgi:hypothetical protein